MYKEANYFNDEAFAQQVFLHQLLYRKLLKFAYDNECMIESEWGTTDEHWCIAYDHTDRKFETYNNFLIQMAALYFSSEEAAERALKEVVEPFIKEYPDFKW